MFGLADLLVWDMFMRVAGANSGKHSRPSELASPRWDMQRLAQGFLREWSPRRPERVLSEQISRLGEGDLA